MGYNAAKEMIQLILDRHSKSLFCNVTEYELMELKKIIDAENNAMRLEIAALQQKIMDMEDENSIPKPKNDQQATDSRSTNKIDKSEAVVLYSKGESMAEIATHYGCSINAVKKMLVREGITPEKRYSRRYSLKQSNKSFKTAH